VTEQLKVATTICTCGESNPGVIIVFQGEVEHHCLPPQPCRIDVAIPGLIDALAPFLAPSEENNEQ
jgi:hypothetical protein